MILDSAIIIAGVCGPDNLIGYETGLFDRRGYPEYKLAANCDVDKNFFIENTKGQFCVVSSITARGMSRSYLEGFPLSEHIFPIWGTTTLYVASKRLQRDVHDVIDIALKDAKRWNEGKKNPNKKVYICGGSQIYKEALKSDKVRDMYLTFIPENFKFEVPKGFENYYTPIYFPEVNWKEWQEVGATNLSEEVVVKRYRR